MLCFMQSHKIRVEVSPAIPEIWPGSQNLSCYWEVKGCSQASGREFDVFGLFLEKDTCDPAMRKGMGPSRTALLPSVKMHLGSEFSFVEGKRAAVRGGGETFLWHCTQQNSKEFFTQQNSMRLDRTQANKAGDFRMLDPSTDAASSSEACVTLEMLRRTGTSSARQYHGRLQSPSIMAWVLVEKGIALLWISLWPPAVQSFFSSGFWSVTCAT